MGLQPHHIAKKEMIESNEQTTTKVEYPKFITDMLDNLFEFMGEGFIDVSDVVGFPDYD